MSHEKNSKYNKNVKKSKEIHFKQEKCDGITKKHVTKSKTIVDTKKGIPEIENLMNLANDAIASNNYDDAFDYFNQIIDKHSYFDAYNKKGFLLLEIGEYESAIDCFNKSIDLTKNNYDAHIGKALSYNKLLEKNSDLFYELELFTNLNIACILNPEAMLLKIDILINMGMIKEAKECIEALPNDIISEDNFDNYLLYLFESGRVYYYLGNYLNAFYLLYYYVSLDESNVDVWLLLAFISSNLSKYDYALKCYDKVLELDDTFYDALLLKAELLVNLHRNKEAIDCFNNCPDEYMSEDYKKLMEFANNHYFTGTKYFGVSKINYIDSHNTEYVFVDMDNGFREIYGFSLDELTQNANKNLFKEIKYLGDFNARDYIICYYLFPNLNFGHNELIFSILNSDMLERIDKSRLNLDELLKDKNNIEKRIINSLIRSMESSLKYAYKKNYTGIFGVLPSKYPGLWVYADLVRAKYLGWSTMYEDSLDKLEILVKDNRLLWYVFDEDLKNKYEKKFNIQNDC